MFDEIVGEAGPGAERIKALNAQFEKRLESLPEDERRKLLEARDDALLSVKRTSQREWALFDGAILVSAWGATPIATMRFLYRMADCSARYEKSALMSRFKSYVESKLRDGTLRLSDLSEGLLSRLKIEMTGSEKVRSKESRAFDTTVNTVGDQRRKRRSTTGQRNRSRDRDVGK